MAKDDIAFLAELEAVIRSRIDGQSEQSYTARLVSEGPKRLAQKVGEEAIEVALASVAGDRDELLDESADLLYHLSVLLVASDVSLADVVAVLERRHHQA